MSHAITHIAGEMISLTQCCTRCGEILVDYRKVMIPEGGDVHPRGFEPTSFVTYMPSGIMKGMVSGRYPGAIDCAPFVPNS
jgi:hypothetical protein